MAKFVKGQSGNPNGRPKGVSQLSEYARSLLPEVFLALAKMAQDDSERGEVRCKAAKILAERGMGAIINTLQVEGPGVTVDQLPNNRVDIEKLIQSQQPN